ncbi:hypothetical protein SAMN04488128_106348 [Chitinophaga eiseniae]|uniref:Uncharacterized protein n=1 Tax=Chitinophaga eiseniae TaxID=634771 RepID=A0A1T4TV43_9BACT|nr:hypothetical protein SAMN04488128_106348 [Chitinophaga eiseniae]
MALRFWKVLVTLTKQITANRKLMISFNRKISSLHDHKATHPLV